MKSKLNLSQYRKKRVRVTDIDGDTHAGKVTMFVPGKDNDNGEDAIVIDDSIWLDESEIKSITAITE